MSKTLKEKLQSEFDALNAKVNAILATSAPLRQRRDDDFNIAMALRKERDVEIKKIEEGLHEMQMDLGLLAKALGGRRMSERRDA